MYDETREPENRLMSERLAEVKSFIESTIDVGYYGNGVIMLESRDDKFWNTVFQDLRQHNYQINKLLEGTLYIEKGPDPRERHR